MTSTRIASILSTFAIAISIGCKHTHRKPDSDAESITATIQDSNGGYLVLCDNQTKSSDGSTQRNISVEEFEAGGLNTKYCNVPRGGGNPPFPPPAQVPPETGFKGMKKGLVAKADGDAPCKIADFNPQFSPDGKKTLRLNFSCGVNSALSGVYQCLVEAGREFCKRPAPGSAGQAEIDPLANGEFSVTLGDSSSTFTSKLLALPKYRFTDYSSANCNESGAELYRFTYAGEPSGGLDPYSREAVKQFCQESSVEMTPGAKAGQQYGNFYTIYSTQCAGNCNNASMSQAVEWKLGNFRAECAEKFSNAVAEQFQKWKNSP